MEGSLAVADKGGKEKEVGREAISKGRERRRTRKEAKHEDRRDFLDSGWHFISSI